MDVQIGHFQVIDVSVSKPVLEQNLSNETEFELLENEPAVGNTFSYMYESFHTKDSSDTEAKGNAEMAD